MAVTHINRMTDTYYLHVGRTKTGKPRYWFSRSAEGELADELPEGYEVYENPGSQVFLRKIVPEKVTPFEVATVNRGLEKYASAEKCLLDVQGEHIVVYHAEKSHFGLDEYRFAFREPETRRHYLKILRFTLSDEDERIFRVQRWCFRGAIDDWIDLWQTGSEGMLADLVQTYCPHIGKESFFDLI